MSETKKFTKEELDEIKKLREANQAKVTEFGQVELELILANQRIESLVADKKELEEKFIGLQTQERELVKKLNKKYGAGTVDLSNGEFTPSN
jgi:chromosome segregation ATPase